MAARRERWIGILLAAASVAITLAVLEVVARVLRASGSDDVRYSVEEPFPPDPRLGYRVRADTRIHAEREIDGETIYAVDYSIDPRHRRWDPSAAPSKEAERFALFFGGSFVFGQGVEDGQTLPRRFEEQVPGLRALNYGVPGWGPAQMLELLRDPALAGQIGPSRGLAVYVFIDNHVQRAIGSLYVWIRWARDFPDYRLRDGELQRVGSFRSARPVRSALYGVLAQSAFFRRLPVDWPRPVSDEHLAFTAKLVAEAAQTFRRRFGGELVTVVYPYSRYAPRMVPALRREGVRVLDYTHLFDPLGPRERFRVHAADHHPSPLAHRILAERLAEDLGPLRGPAHARAGAARGG